MKKCSMTSDQDWVIHNEICGEVSGWNFAVIFLRLEFPLSWLMANLISLKYSGTRWAAWLSIPLRTKTMLWAPLYLRSCKKMLGLPECTLFFWVLLKKWFWKLVRTTLFRQFWWPPKFYVWGRDKNNITFIFLWKIPVLKPWRIAIYYISVLSCLWGFSFWVKSQNRTVSIVIVSFRSK